MTPLFVQIAILQPILSSMITEDAHFARCVVAANFTLPVRDVQIVDAISQRQNTPSSTAFSLQRPSATASRQTNSKTDTQSTQAINNRGRFTKTLIQLIAERNQNPDGPQHNADLHPTTKLPIGVHVAYIVVIFQQRLQRTSSTPETKRFP